MMNCIHLSLFLDMGENVRKILCISLPKHRNNSKKTRRNFLRRFSSSDWIISPNIWSWILPDNNRSSVFFQSRTNFFLTSHDQTPTSWWLKKPSCYYMISSIWESCSPKHSRWFSQNMCNHPLPTPNTNTQHTQTGLPDLLVWTFHPLVGGGPSSRPTCRAQTCATKKKSANNLRGPFMTHLWDAKTWSGIEVGGQK